MKARFLRNIAKKAENWYDVVQSRKKAQLNHCLRKLPIQDCSPIRDQQSSNLYLEKAIAQKESLNTYEEEKQAISFREVSRQ